jgi:hypothetical protein
LQLLLQDAIPASGSGEEDQKLVSRETDDLRESWTEEQSVLTVQDCEYQRGGDQPKAYPVIRLFHVKRPFAADGGEQGEACPTYLA